MEKEYRFTDGFLQSAETRFIAALWNVRNLTFIRTLKKSLENMICSTKREYTLFVCVVSICVLESLRRSIGI